MLRFISCWLLDLYTPCSLKISTLSVKDIRRSVQQQCGMRFIHKPVHNLLPVNQKAHSNSHSSFKNKIITPLEQNVPMI